MTDKVKIKPTKNIPTAKFVFLDILEKAKQWSKVYPLFKEGLEEGYKNPSSCFRKTGDGNDKTYDVMVKEMREKIEAIAGTDWGKTYHTKMRAAKEEEMERFNKNYMNKFGPLGLESLLLGNYEPLDDGIECGDKAEEAEAKDEAKEEAKEAEAKEDEDEAKEDEDEAKEEAKEAEAKEEAAEAEAKAKAKAEAKAKVLEGGYKSNGYRRRSRRRKHNKSTRKSRKKSRQLNFDS